MYSHNFYDITEVFYSLCFDYLCEYQSGGKSVYILLYYTILKWIFSFWCCVFSRLGCNITIRSADIGVRQGQHRGNNNACRINCFPLLQLYVRAEGILFYNTEKAKALLCSMKAFLTSTFLRFFMIPGHKVFWQNCSFCKIIRLQLL